MRDPIRLDKRCVELFDCSRGSAVKYIQGGWVLVDSKVEEATGLETWKKALENINPSVEVRSRRVGGATFQIPTPVRESRKYSLGMKWLIGYARKRNEKTMAQKLAAEILAASKEEGAAYKKKEDTLRMAEANKAFSHFRF